MVCKNTERSQAHIISCSVFKPALDFLLDDEAFAGVSVTYLPSHLHLYPDKLKGALLGSIGSLAGQDLPVILLYGSCFPGIDEFCHAHGIKRIRGEHCYEIMLGWNRFQEIMAQTAGTYFLEQDLVRNFQTYCIEPLELHDDEMKRLCLGHYQRLIYLQQPNDPDLTKEIEDIGRFLRLPVITLQVDYSHLKERLLAILNANKKSLAT